MPVTVVVNVGWKPVPKIDTPEKVVQQAQEAGNADANMALAVTRAFININQNGLIPEYDKPESPSKFRFQNGQLRLTLRPKIYIANDITECERDIWAQHEQDHVKDYQKVITQMDRKIRSHNILKKILFIPKWRSIFELEPIKTTIHENIERIFDNMVREASRKRDTPGEIIRIRRKILYKCPVLEHTVSPGETLSKLAKIYYGNHRFWPSIYKKNIEIIGKDENLIIPGQKLVIPKRE